jgi:hypothetical protein
MTVRPAPQKPATADDQEPSTFFEVEQRRRRHPELGVGEISGDMKYPRLPSNSPWASDPVPAEEPIDRSEDGPIITRGENRDQNSRCHRRRRRY